MMGEEEEEEESVCVCGGSGSVCFCSQGGVCIPPFLHSHTPSPLSCDRVYDEVLQGGDRQLWQKRIAQDVVCICVCA